MVSFLIKKRRWSRGCDDDAKDGDTKETSERTRRQVTVEEAKRREERTEVKWGDGNWPIEV